MIRAHLGLRSTSWRSAAKSLLLTPSSLPPLPPSCSPCDSGYTDPILNCIVWRGLPLWFSKCGSQANNMSIIWELARNIQQKCKFFLLWRIILRCNLTYTVPQRVSSGSELLWHTAVICSVYFIGSSPFSSHSLTSRYHLPKKLPASNSCLMLCFQENAS